MTITVLKVFNPKSISRVIYLGSSFSLLIRLSRDLDRRLSLLGDLRRPRLLDRLRSPLPLEIDLFRPLLLERLRSLLLDLLRRSLDRRRSRASVSNVFKSIGIRSM